MSEKEISFRTSIFPSDGRNGYLYRFWIMSPSFEKDGFQIKEHDKGDTCGCINRIADGLSASEALKKMAALESKARAASRPITAFDDRDLGPEFRDAIPFTDHLNALVAETNYDRLRKRRPKSSAFRLKKP
ncbi:MAG: hypothetical protein ACAH83_01290 [Alphaproteobacteria bacterium]